MAKAKVREITPEEIIYDDRNLNRHTDKGRELVDKSFSELGAGRSGVSDKNGKMIAGNVSAETAVSKGLKILEVETDGDTYVIVKRNDLDLDSKTDNRARKLALADNATSAISLNWDFEQMANVADDFGFDVGEWGLDLSGHEKVNMVNGGDENSEWVGMPGFESIDNPLKAIISFESEEDRRNFEATFPQIQFLQKQSVAWSTWWPYKHKDDLVNIKYESAQ